MAILKVNSENMTFRSKIYERIEEVRANPYAKLTPVFKIGSDNCLRTIRGVFTILLNLIFKRKNGGK